MKSFKQKCIELRKKDLTLNEIVELTGRSKTTVYFHIKGQNLSERKKRKISNDSRKKALALSSARKGIALRPFKPFTKWTEETVLLTSHLAFDGEIGKSCVYNNRSEALVGRFSDLMNVVYDFPPKRYLNELTGVTKISYNNVAMANFFLQKEKELISSIIFLSSNLQKEFIRAFFDDEGCMDVRKNRRSIRGYQKDKKILIIVKTVLWKLGIESKLQGINEVVISGKENLKKFQAEINFSKGVRINPNRTNSIWKKNLEKRKLLDMAIKSFKT